MPCGVLASVFLNSSSMFNHGGRHFYSALRPPPPSYKNFLWPCKNVCTKEASLIQFFNEFFSVLETFRNQRNHSFLMALHRNSTELEDPTLHQYHKYATLYPLGYMKRQWELNRTLDNVISAHSTAVNGCEWTLMKSMRLPRKDLFNNTHRRNCVLLNSVKEFIEKQS